MGKASVRKRALTAPITLPSPKNDAEVARGVLHAYGTFEEARKIAEAFAEAMQSPKVRRWFHALGLALGDVQRVLGEHANDARVTLGLPVSLAGTAGKGADGSSVVVGLDGVVQHSAPDEVLRELGLKSGRGAAAGSGLRRLK